MGEDSPLFLLLLLLLRETSATSGLGFADCGLERETSATSGLGFAICGLGFKV